MSATPPGRAAPLTRRTLLAGVAVLAAVPPDVAAALATTAEPRMTLPIGPFIADALDGLVAEGRLSVSDPVARHLDGIAAFRASDGRPLTVADLDPAGRDVDRFLATQLIERVSGDSLPAHLERCFLASPGLRDARLIGTSPVVAIDCRSGDGRRWLQS